MERQLSQWVLVLLAASACYSRANIDECGSFGYKCFNETHFEMCIQEASGNMLQSGELQACPTGLMCVADSLSICSYALPYEIEETTVTEPYRTTMLEDLNTLPTTQNIESTQEGFHDMSNQQQQHEKQQNQQQQRQSQQNQQEQQQEQSQQNQQEEQQEQSQQNQQEEQQEQSQQNQNEQQQEQSQQNQHEQQQEQSQQNQQEQQQERLQQNQQEQQQEQSQQNQHEQQQEQSQQNQQKQQQKQSQQNQQEQQQEQSQQNQREQQQEQSQQNQQGQQQEQSQQNQQEQQQEQSQQNQQEQSQQKQQHQQEEGKQQQQQQSPSEQMDLVQAIEPFNIQQAEIPELVQFEEADLGFVPQFPLAYHFQSSIPSTSRFLKQKFSHNYEPKLIHIEPSKYAGSRTPFDVGNFTCPGAGLFPAPPSCTEYHLCIQIGPIERHYVRSCWKGFEFSPRWRVCLPRILSDCLKNGSRSVKASSDEDSQSQESNQSEESNESNQSDSSESR